MLDPLTFFHWDKPRLLIDVRKTKSFKKGSFAGAISCPVKKGEKIDTLKNLSKFSSGHVPVHIFDDDGNTAVSLSQYYNIQYLEGGYERFIKWREEAFTNNGPPLKIICGNTGSGKTDLLHSLLEVGHQVIDLEQIANHRGSVFGQLEGPQPSHEHFNNTLLKLWLSQDPHQVLWLEEKGPFLGGVGIPPPLYVRMQSSLKLILNVPFELRLNRITESYGNIVTSQLHASIRALEKRMGMSANHKALHYLRIGQLEDCFRILLKYYDAAYAQRRAKNWSGETVEINYSGHPTDTLIEKLGSL